MLNTYVGQLENRLPLLNIVLPVPFLQENPEVMENLKNNEQVLISGMDIHETWMNILHFPNGSAPVHTGHSVSHVMKKGSRNIYLQNYQTGIVKTPPSPKSFVCANNINKVCIITVLQIEIKEPATIKEAVNDDQKPYNLTVKFLREISSQ